MTPAITAIWVYVGGSFLAWLAIGLTLGLFKKTKKRRGRPVNRPTPSKEQ